MITDGMGGLVWLDNSYQQPYNFQVQEYKGERYLTFWSGNDGVRGHGAGTYHMLNSSYDEVYEIKAANNLDGDLHEFRITSDNTALITVYNVEPADYSSIHGPSNGWQWECLFQEIDLETGEALFEWRASEHIAFDRSYETRCRTCGISQDSAWDWFHINSIDKDPQGNYIISSRYTRAVIHINGTTGEIIWILGGKSNMFQDLSGGEVTKFASQHHARWRDNYTAITIFDNENPGPNLPSKGLYIDLNFEKMTAKLRHSYKSLKRESTYSQGSLQVLDNGHVLLGYGYLGEYTEYTMEGKQLCDVHLEPKAYFGRGSVQSYRVMKYDWVGKPRWAPKIVQTDGRIYMSWMGATENTHWLIEEADSQDATDEEFDQVKTIIRKGFETVTLSSGVQKSYVRATALDEFGNRLGTTKTVECVPGQELSLEDTTEELTDEFSEASTEMTEDEESPLASHALVILAIVAVGVVAIAGPLIMVGYYIQRKWRYRTYQRAAAVDGEKATKSRIADAGEFDLDDFDTQSLLSDEGDRDHLMKKAAIT